MARRFVRRFLPDRGKLESGLPRWLSRVLLSPQLWHLNRHSVSRGLAIGMFWAWIPMPMQSIPGVLCAIALRGNVLLTYAACWLSNPFTMVPWVWISYRIGLLVTGAKPMGNMVREIRQVIGTIGEHGVISGFRHFWHYVTDNFHVVWVFGVGSVIFAVLTSGATYLAIQWLWRWNLVRRWKNRGNPQRCPTCRSRVLLPAWTRGAPGEAACPGCGERVRRRHRIGRGLAAVARKARQIAGAT
jgi:uncharacterized protein (DUF2062 family)